jgi:hypothetical protein
LEFGPNCRHATQVSILEPCKQTITNIVCPLKRRDCHLDVKNKMKSEI